MNPELQQRIIQKQATEIGNQKFQITALQCELDMMVEQINELNQKNQDSADVKTDKE